MILDFPFLTYIFWLLSDPIFLMNVSMHVLFPISKEVLFVDSGDPWNPRAETVTKVMTMLKGIHRVLKPDGIFISISFGQVVDTILFITTILSNYLLPL